MRRRWKYLPVEVRREILRLSAKGLSQEAIAAQVDVAQRTVSNVVRPFGGVVRREMWTPSAGRLSLDERVNIKIWLEAGESFRDIGRRLERAPSTICREVGGAAGRRTYAPMAAHRRAYERARRPKATKLGSNPQLCARVVGDLEQLWSPAQIGIRLRTEFPCDREMWVSHETIYKSIYIQGRGELRRELARCLRTGRAQRRHQ